MSLTMSEAFPSKYWRPADLPKPVLLQIKLVTIETIGQPGKQERKPIMYFTKPDGGEVTKSLPLNVTNGRMLQKLYGDNLAGWEGKPIVLYSTTVDVRGEQKDAIRLRAPKSNGSAAPEPPAGSTNDEVDDSIPF
jgi:hypothetical protein